MAHAERRERGDIINRPEEVHKHILHQGWPEGEITILDSSSNSCCILQGPSQVPLDEAQLRELSRLEHLPIAGSYVCQLVQTLVDDLDELRKLHRRQVVYVLDRIRRVGKVEYFKVQQEQEPMVPSYSVLSSKASLLRV